MHIIKKMLLQATLIVVLSTVLSLGVNMIRPDGLPIATAGQSVVDSTKSDPHISVQDAAMLFLSKRATFIDARSEGAYEQGHIKGAINIPAELFDLYFEGYEAELPKDAKIITYCDGELCELGDSLAASLRAAGYEDVRTIRNGWTLWQQEGLPSE